MKHDIVAKFCLRPANQLCLSTSKKRSLSITRLLGFESPTKSPTDIMLKVTKEPMDVFPRVPQTDAILFIVKFQGLSHGKISVSSGPMKCKMTTVTIDGQELAIHSDVRDF